MEIANFAKIEQKKNVHLPEVEIKDSWEKEIKPGSEASADSVDFLIKSFNYPYVSIGLDGNYLACATAYQYYIYKRKDDGAFKIFNEKGETVISQSFRQSAITSINFKPMLGEDDIEELVIYYHELFTFDPFPLIFKKYLLYGQEIVLNVASVGPNAESNLFDLDYDIVTGKIINQPNVTTRIIGIGFPFIGMYVSTEASPKYTLAGLVANKSSEVSTAVFSYAKSLLNIGASETNLSTNFRPTQLNSQVMIEDGNRSATRLSVDPSNRFCAVSDNLGRVLLFDVSDASIIHIWKGIRDAQLGWIQIAHDNDPAIVSNLLVIYGNTGILEIHAIPTCARVAALNVGKGFKLAQTPVAMIGGMHWKGLKQRFNACCYLISQSGDVKRIKVTAELYE
ncbi:Rab3 GTPase-activating protein non-catalytic subunit [Boothiomyces macroporosus]|uniref:Rab3 GTPase-activating protein non-catalytic subunit n=1 Tax=Boothiomyces macroporosus TaxID=261099 RepID=A0AAD5UG23_9FUNG|nr:Rab3 GTPase-activating protein non-catalytic subunit [Boothiomyces macroporosus]